MIFARGWDLASSEKQLAKSDPDYTVGAKVGVEVIPSNIAGVNVLRIYIDDIIRGRWEALQRNQIIMAAALADPKDVLWVIEDFAAFKDVYTSFKTLLAGIRNVNGYHEQKDKVSRAHELAVAMEAGNVYMKKAPWNQELLDELRAFPNGAHDDMVDAICEAIWGAVHCSNTLILTGGDVSALDEYQRSTMQEIEFFITRLEPVSCQREAYQKFIRRSLLVMANKYLMPQHIKIYEHINATIKLLDDRFGMKSVTLY